MKKGTSWHRLTRNGPAVAGLILLCVVAIMATAAPLVAPFHPTEMVLKSRLQPPSLKHVFGTDAMGRDVLSRVLYGARLTMLIALAGVCIGGAIGIGLGLISGYFGGVLDLLLMRAMDIGLAFPSLLLAMLIISVLGPGVTSVVMAIAVFAVPVYARVVRGAVLSVKQEAYIEAARAFGCSHRDIMTRHLLPNAIPPMIVQSSLLIANAVLIASSLSFLGLGVQPPSPEWGAMLAGGRLYLRSAPWVTIFPGLAIVLAVLGLNLLGDGLRDVLDPRLRM
ncbi:MAG: ABC transporter permease [Candidatus Bipolaricaulis sp.]|nr:ABC transporter permease [Candidatus Bipolaricaulis sp.]